MKWCTSNRIQCTIIIIKRLGYDMQLNYNHNRITKLTSYFYNSMTLVCLSGVKFPWVHFLNLIKQSFTKEDILCIYIPTSYFFFIRRMRHFLLFQSVNENKVTGDFFNLCLKSEGNKMHILDNSWILSFSFNEAYVFFRLMSNSCIYEK